MRNNLQITSRQNETIKSMRSLLESKGRASSGLFLAEGLRAVIQAVQSGARIEHLVYNPEELVSSLGKQTLEQAEAAGIPLLEVSSEVLDSLARKEKPQGILAVVHQSWRKLSDLSEQPAGLWIGLEAIQNPGNLGTILRVSDAVGVNGLILLENSTDPYDPVAVKASMGSIFTVPIYKANQVELLAWLKDKPNIKTIGTSDRSAKDFSLFAYPADCLLLMGSERQGLSEELLAACSDTVAIPMEGVCDSLNIAVATGIIAYQAYLQKKTKA
jgi:TrmH family RNA methyltransferase